MEQQALVSIIMPTYNRAHILAHTIASVCAQTYTNWELIIVDDGSTDDTRAVIESFDDARIRPFYQPNNANVCVALNVGLSHARGTYIARIDSDDLWQPEKLEKQMAYLQAHPDCGACFSKVDLIDESGQCVNQIWPELYAMFQTEQPSQKAWVVYLLEQGNCLCQSSVVIPAHVWQAVGPYNLALLQSQDYDLWLRIVSRYPIHVVPQPLVQYRWQLDEQIKLSRSYEEANTRFYNEQMLIRLHFFDRIRDEDFLRLFGADLVKPDAHTPLELACEKMLWCLHAGSGMRLAGVFMGERLLSTPQGRETLEQTYHFTPKHLYAYSKEHLWYDTELKRQYDELQHRYNIQNKALGEREAERAAYQAQFEKERARREQLEHLHAQTQAALDACLHSTSWKVTRPLRAIGRRLRPNNPSHG